MSRRAQKQKKIAIQSRQRNPDPPADAWDIVFWMPEKGRAPGREWLITVPDPVRLMMVSILDSVRDGPPQSFGPSEYWHVMRGRMKGLHEARDRHGDTLYRLFCVLDRDAPKHGMPRPALVVLCGGEKPNGTEMGDDVYDEALDARDHYLKSSPRAFLPPPGIPASVR